MATSTPWGPSQITTRIAPGIVQYSTAGHGGIHLSAGRLAKMPEIYRKRDLRFCGPEWFEEDCEVALVILSFPEYWSTKIVQFAHETFAQYYAAVV